MDFRHLIVTCIFSKLRLPFDNQKVKENYAIFLKKLYELSSKIADVSTNYSAIFSKDNLILF